MSDFFKYVGDNASWIFSGVGITALTGIGWLVRSRLKQDPTQSQVIKQNSFGVQAGRDVNFGLSKERDSK